jgi:dipeptidyl aminopeptidase/acylaminoacyl peptidase
MIVADGLPSMPHKHAVLAYWARRGFWVLHPRYRGTWESGGQFLDHSPEQDVFDVIDSLEQGLTSVWTGEKFSVAAPRIVVLGASFGGTVALLASQDERVVAAVALAPVLDWSEPSPSEPHHVLREVMRKGYGAAYRFTDVDWDRLVRGELVSPLRVVERLVAQKLFLAHAKDDNVVRAGPTQQLARQLGCASAFPRRGGHFSASASIRGMLGWSVRRFLQQIFPSS